MVWMQWVRSLWFDVVLAWKTITASRMLLVNDEIEHMATECADGSFSLHQSNELVLVRLCCLSLWIWLLDTVGHDFFVFGSFRSIYMSNVSNCNSFQLICFQLIKVWWYTRHFEGIVFLVHCCVSPSTFSEST